MALYQRLSDGSFGISTYQVQQDLGPEIAFVEGADLTDWGYAPYETTEPPSAFAVEAAPMGGIQQWEDRDPPRRLIPKSVVQERMHALGKLGDAFAALNSSPIYFGRWFAPDWPNVYFDDEGLLQILSAIGCTEAEIDAITAP